MNLNLAYLLHGSLVIGSNFKTLQLSTHLQNTRVMTLHFSIPVGRNNAGIGVLSSKVMNNSSSNNNNNN